MSQLHRDLLEHQSATLALEQWCRFHKITSRPPPIDGTSPNLALIMDKGTERDVITAQQIHVGGDQQHVLSYNELGLLALHLKDSVTYRHVHLMFDGAIVSKADNWYVASRLDPGMNEILTATNTPFGKVVKPLHCRRITVSSRRWLPTSSLSLQNGRRSGGVECKPDSIFNIERAETAGSETQNDILQIPEVILEICAILCRGDNHQPVCYVRERYQGKLMDFSASMIPNVQ
ncbi:hypothetical protein NQ176_g2316 [Zarea fungicola]|uniref:Uncharacterized protein n=1 Tax=Zarea fungicola TaxID=93591 RepID=A0ACC1NRD5_9HYPO|nr:hypothetical protein NQ176_g2316 [Lecanicillium fungicola]